MILILGSNKYEQGTDPVIDWLLYYNANFLKITQEDLFVNFSKLNINIDTKKIAYNNICLNDQVNVVWYRHFSGDTSFVSKEDSKFFSQINKELNNEVETFMEYFYKGLENKKWVSDYNKISQINKLSLLNSASSLGLKTPLSSIISNRDDVLSFMTNNQLDQIIIKQFSDKSRYYYTQDDKTYVSLTKGLTYKEVKKLNTNFFPTLFQERIRTDFEIRVFYLDGQFFATAIVSDEKFDVDDRKKLINDSSIHNICYELPPDIKEKITKLMVKEGLSIGSIDIIKNKNDEFYFIEINPMGQFVFESNKCNYHIPKLIAEYLINKDKK